MQIVRGLHNLRPAHRGSALTIGNYDGVHRGHQGVLAVLCARARELGVVATVVTFEPTPQEYFGGASAPPRLMRLRDKLLALSAAGVQRVLCLRFDAALAGLSPTAFVEHVLVQGLGARHVVVGADFRFGSRRRGDLPLLADCGVRDGFTVAAAPTFVLDGERVSSTAVRHALAAGDFEHAARLLGRPYRISGRVIGGRRLGRGFGYPTANLPLGRRVCPLHGIFAVRVDGAGADWLPGVASLGTRPTVGGGELLLEAHLFDFDAELYGRRLVVEFVAKLREEEHFPSIAALTAQMRRDEAQARAILARDTN
jgi:riboflavin kinase / FMN adenylyltransferase